MKIDVSDVELFFDVEGAKVVASGDDWVERPTVVLLHAGPGADHSLYKDLVGPQLASVAQVVYLDQRGDGRSSRSDASQWNLETWSDDLRGFLDALEIERPVLLGSAIGSLVALSFASRYPDRPAGLVLVSAVARYVHQRSVSEFDRLGGAQAGEVAARYFGDPTEGDVRRLHERLPAALHPPRARPRRDRAHAHQPRGDGQLDARRGGKARPARSGRPDRLPGAALRGRGRPVVHARRCRGARRVAAGRSTTFRRIPAAGHGVFRDAPWALDEAAEFIRASASVRSEGDDGALVGFSDADLRLRLHELRVPFRGARRHVGSRSGLPRLRQPEGRQAVQRVVRSARRLRAALLRWRRLLRWRLWQLRLTSRCSPTATRSPACTRCALAKTRTQVVFGAGSPTAELMFVGEAPGFHEDKQGVPFVGAAGKLLSKLLDGIGLDARRRLHRERPQVPASGQPQPAAGGDRGVRGAPLPPDRAHPADGSWRRSATSRRSCSRASPPGSRRCTGASSRSCSAAGR